MSKTMARVSQIQQLQQHQQQERRGKDYQNEFRRRLSLEEDDDSTSSEEEEEETTTSDDTSDSESGENKRRSQDDETEDDDWPAKKKVKYSNTQGGDAECTQGTLEDYGEMNFVLPGWSDSSTDGSLESPVSARPLSPSPYSIVKTSKRSNDMSTYIDTTRRMPLGEFHRLWDVDTRYPIVKQRGPYGDGLVLHNTIFKVKHFITTDCQQGGDEEESIAQAVIVDPCTDIEYLLDDRFFDDWSHVSGRDLVRLHGPDVSQNSY